MEKTKSVNTGKYILGIGLFLLFSAAMALRLYFGFYENNAENNFAFHVPVYLIFFSFILTIYSAIFTEIKKTLWMVLLSTVVLLIGSVYCWSFEIPRNYFILIVVLGGINIWLIWSVVRVTIIKRDTEHREHQEKIKEFTGKSDAIVSEIPNYKKYLSTLEAKTARYKMLSVAAHELGGLLNPAQIREQLIKIVQSIYPEGKVNVLPPDQLRDNFTAWVLQRNTPLLITDVNKDLRFPRQIGAPLASSIMATPLMNEKKVVGVVRVDGIQPNSFDSEDLRLLDIISLIASLSLDNANLFAQVQELSITDPLTGLYTHKFFQERFNEEVLRAGRYHMGLGVLLSDIDHFKRYNDTYGHQVGDEVLKNVADTIKQLVEETDIVARYGGEEFIVLLSPSDEQRSLAVAEKIRATIEKQRFNFSGHMTSVTLSLGVATFPADATITSQLIRIADERLYKAKESGRNQVRGTN